MFELRIFPDSIQVAKSYSTEILVFRQTSLNRDKFFTKKNYDYTNLFPECHVHSKKETIDVFTSYR